MAPMPREVRVKMVKCKKVGTLPLRHQVLHLRSLDVSRRILANDQSPGSEPRHYLVFALSFSRMVQATPEVD